MDANVSINNSSYKQKLDTAISDTVKNWWNNMSKDEILNFIRDTESIDENMLRQIFANEGVSLIAKLIFDTDKGMVATDFNSHD